MRRPVPGRAPNDQVRLEQEAKSCKINYEKHNEQIGYNVIKVIVDNDKCILGYARMYQEALHYKWTLH
jgi:hypothetical protein